MIRLLSVCTLLIAAAHYQAVRADDPAAPAPASTSAGTSLAGAGIPLRIMSFNIEWGGAHVSFENVVEVVRRSQADVVGIQEAEGNLQHLADALGWHYNLRQYAISRFPLAEPPGAGGKYVLVEVEPGRMVAFANVHLPSDPYGPDAVRDGASPEAVLELERKARLPFIQPVLAALQPLIEQGIPVFLTGDFNAPSYADWTEETVGSRPFVRYPLDWPVSRAVVAAGLHDSWREQYPDPLSHPGLTWWAGRPPLPEYAPGANDPQDRIDYVWFAGAATLTASRIAGEKGAVDVSLSVSSRSFKVGDPIAVSWSNAPGNRNDYLAIYDVDHARDNEDIRAWVYINALPEGSLDCDGGNLDGQKMNGEWPLEPGNYVVKLVKDDGYEPLAESGRFTVE